ncbi:hypothetical protein BKA62DRAFT_693375 [Auriculariales sp. MPI-PUGE-AT-0066]|nr:hypothetical protein BKA62DRAFT_693375 [Auriculariales sp. MPI-PUGE-AT-0066]
MPAIQLGTVRRGNGTWFDDDDEHEQLKTRPSSPEPRYLTASGSSSDGTTSPLLGSFKSQNNYPDASRRKRLDGESGLLRSARLSGLRCLRWRFCPTRPASILLFLASFALFAVALTLFLIWYLNPDKVVLPWRAYCAVPPDSPKMPAANAIATETVSPAQLLALYNSSAPFAQPNVPLFPPEDFPFDWETLPPTGIFLGVMSIDSATELRMLARTTWASHIRSRHGAFPGDGGRSTSRTIVRFIIGQPRPEWKEQIRLEQELYQDIEILPITENMNSGKTHAYYSWAAENAWVPPHIPESDPQKFPPYVFDYGDATIAPQPLAPHDPRPSTNATRREWVRPDFVFKTDDDAFIMLAELEARLRVELYLSRAQGLLMQPPSDPLTFWGYLVKNKFMAGEIYGLTWRLVRWVATEPKLRSMTHGAEDKQTSKWIRLHPSADHVRWQSEHCWIYDHPRANKVYAHGFLFPSEVKRLREEVTIFMRRVRDAIGLHGRTLTSRTEELETTPTSLDDRTLTNFDTISESGSSSEYPLESETRDTISSTSGLTADSWWTDNHRKWFARTTVSKFGGRYVSPVAGRDDGRDGMKWRVEGLVEGSTVSRLVDFDRVTPLEAYKAREPRHVRYEDRRVGGTIAVHFIKHKSWYLETASAFLAGDEEDEFSPQTPPELS